MKDAPPTLDLAFRRRLRGFELDVEASVPSEWLVIFGPSGAGKTLTLGAIAGLLVPDEGTIRIQGNIVFDHTARINIPPQRRRVGVVFQHYALFPHLSVRRNLTFGLKDGALAERTGALAEQLHVEHLMDRKPHELSGGQQQRVALGRAVLASPALLLLDEPFGALDTNVREQLRTDLLAIQQQLAIPMVVVTHNLEEAYLFGQTTAIMDEGRVLQVGARDDVFMRPRTRRVAHLLAARNLIRGTPTGPVNEEGLLPVRVGATTVLVPAPPEPAGEAVELTIRPEHILLVRPERQAGRLNLLEAQHVRELHLGISRRLFMRVSGWEPAADWHLEVSIPEHVYHVLHVTPGGRLVLMLPPERIHVLAKESAGESA